jgi:hypothetical protein
MITAILSKTPIHNDMSKYRSYTAELLLRIFCVFGLSF